MKNKVLVVSYFFPPVNSPGVQHPTWFYRFLRDFGLRTEALTSSVYIAHQLDYDQPLPEPVHRLPQGDTARKLAHFLARAEVWAQLKVKMWEHCFNWSLVWGYPAACRMLRNDPDFCGILSVSPSVVSHWTGLRLKKKFPHLKWIADFQDPFSGNPLRETLPIVHNWEKKLEREIFQYADHLSANTDTVREIWERNYPQYKSKYVVTWGGFDPEEPIAARPLPARPAPVAAHVGSIYGGRFPNGLVEALYALAQQGRLTPSQLTFAFHGGSDRRMCRKQDQYDYLLEKGYIRLHPEYVPRPEALRIAEEADYLVLFDITPNSDVLQVPAKTFDYARIGRPVLAFTPEGSPAQRILESSRIPMVALAPDAATEKIQDGVLRLLTLPKDPQPPAREFLERYDIRTLTGSLARLFTGR